MLTVFDLAQEDTPLKKQSRNEYAGTCPGCGGNDRFRVKWNADSEKWSFMCRGCWDAQEYLPEKDRKRGWGDAIDYMRHFRKRSFQEAKALLRDVDGSLQTLTSFRDRPGASILERQEVTTQHMKACETALLSPDGLETLEYARGRGLIDQVIQGAHLGFSLQGDIPRLLIPVYNDGRYVAIYRRDIRAECPDGERWKDAKGSSKEELYLEDCLKIKRATVLCEAAIDALSVVQECSDLVNVVATGGTDGARSIRSLARLARMPLVLLAFDADPAGDEAAAWWAERLPNTQRLRPFLHDVNEMLMDGWDIRAWVEEAVEVGQEQEDLCSKCGRAISSDQGLDGFYSDDGKYTCSAHVVRPAPAHAIPDDRDDRTPVRSVEEYWERTRRKLTGIDFSAKTPTIKARMYPVPFPCRQLVTDQDGRMHLKIVGTWHPTECRLMNDTE